MSREERNDELHVVFVCTGNRFRSPLAEAVFRRAAPPGVRTESFGTTDLGPVPPLEAAQEAAGHFDLDLSGHVARALTQVDLARADLVIGFERAHVRAAVVDARARRERTFTLTGLVAILDGIQVAPHADRLASARRALALLDLQRPFESIGNDEVADPLGRAANVQHELAVRVESLVARLAQQLFLEPR